jgi:competence protein ComEC
VTGRRAPTFELGALAGLVGASGVHLLPALPPAWASAPAVAAALLGAWALRRRPLACALAFGACVAAWTALAAQRAIDGWLDPALEGEDLVVEGRVRGLPERLGELTRFELRTYRGPGPRVPGLLRLSWYGDAPALAPGERWRLTVRLRRPRGSVNPGGFDYARWLLDAGIGATGYVRTFPPPQRVAPAGPGLDRLRGALLARLERNLPPGQGAAVAVALAIGETGRISPQTWETLRRTGTVHLVAISGLHVTLLGGLAYALVRRGWPRIGRAARRVPAPVLAAPVAALVALAYAGLAGFAVPARRAALVFALAMAGLAARREVDLTRLLAVALWAVLLTDPLAPLGVGFWLSFGAVAAIAYLAAGRRRGGALREGIRVQAGLGILLAVPVLGFFGLLAPAGLPANLIAVPWVTLVSTPLALLALVAGGVSGLGPALGHAAAFNLEMLLHLLGACARSVPAWSWPVAPAPLLALGLLGAVLLAMPRGAPGRAAGVLCVLVLALWRPPAPAPGEAWVSVLDVGQGLAAIVRTRHHALIYDTGPGYGGRLDAAQTALLPALRQSGLRRVDTLIVSHADGDHAGGLVSLRAGIAIGDILSGTPGQVPGARACSGGQRWTWDGVTMRVLHPPADAMQADGNARSCVLRVDAGDGLLLTGDIGAAQEAGLIRAGLLERTAVVVAPHHGSGGSSSPAFVRAAAPRHVIFSAGYRNRYGHPPGRVRERYAAAGAACWCTAGHGAVHVRLAPRHPPVLMALRASARRYWHAAPPGSDGCAC